MNSRSIAVLRWSGTIAAAGFFTYLLAAFRTTEFGWNPTSFARQLAAALLIAGLPLLLPLLGLPLRRIALRYFATVVIGTIAVETYAAAEETRVVRRHGIVPSQRIVQERAWPFQHHWIGYDLAQQRWVGGD